MSEQIIMMINVKEWMQQESRKIHRFFFHWNDVAASYTGGKIVENNWKIVMLLNKQNFILGLKSYNFKAQIRKGGKQEMMIVICSQAKLECFCAPPVSVFVFWHAK